MQANMTPISREEANQAAARIQALHQYTQEAWERMLTMPGGTHPNERRRRREAFLQRVAEFESSWGTGK